MARVLIVGSGLTGSVTKHFLGSWLAGAGSHQSVLSIAMWESDSASGGRMQSDFFVGPHRCDLGAQYISQNIGGELNDCDIYDCLTGKGPFSLIQNNSTVSGMRPEHHNGQHFIATTGTSNILGTLAPQSEVEFGKKLVRLAYDETATKLLAFADGVDQANAFDAIVLTMPAPQLTKVLGPTKDDSSKLLPDATLERLQHVRYSSRFALAAYYELPSASAKQSVLDSVPWRAKYVMDDDVVRYVSIENFKYETDEQGADHNATTSSADARHILSILVHSSVPFGLAHPDVLKYRSPQSQEDLHPSSVADLEIRKQGVIDTVLQHLTRPSGLPALSAYTPVRTRLVGWEQSQVSRGYYSAEAESAGSGADNSRGVLSAPPDGDRAPALLLSSRSRSSARGVEVSGDGSGERSAGTVKEESPILHVVTPDSSTQRQGTASGPLLVLAGDAFTESNFDGCVRSGRFAAQAVLRHLNLSP